MSGFWNQWLSLNKRNFIRLFFLLTIFLYCRVVFMIFNPPVASVVEMLRIWLGGIRFDLSALMMVFGIYFLLVHIPVKKLWFIRFTLSLAIIGIVFVLISNLLDVAWYEFTHKRTSKSSLSIIAANKNMSDQMMVYFKDYWAIIALLIVSLYYFSKKLTELELNWQKNDQVESKVKLLNLLFWVPLSIIIFRGGIQLKPISSANAAIYARPQLTVYVLNTPFVLLKSLFEPEIYLPGDVKNLDEAERFFHPISVFSNNQPRQKNIVFFILESFSKEYIGFFNKESKYTPFLDSLIRHSIVFDNFYANSLHSLDGVTTLLTGIPPWLDDSYVTSPFSVNKINSLVASARKNGYSSMFFHGAKNGSMSFDLLAQIVGFDNAYFMNEYPEKSHYDGTWGIYDHYFLDFMLDKITKQKEPFLCVFFSLSSHHPFKIPQELEKKFPEGHIPILKTIAYTDWSIRKFFEKYKQHPNFKNTLFVFTADHTSVAMHDIYETPTGIYSVPFFIYDPETDHFEKIDTLMQQSDVYPSLVDYMGWQETLLAWGKSYRDSTIKQRFFMAYKNQTFLLYDGKYYFYQSKDSPVGLYQSNDIHLKHNLLDTREDLVKKYHSMASALIYSFNYRVLYNQMTPAK